MPYNKQTWVDKQTPVDAAHMNYLEDALAELWALVDQVGGGGGLPIGGIFPWAGHPNPPAGHLFCDGAAILRADFPELYAIIGDHFGAGDGSTTFNLPDTRGRMLVGFGTHGYVAFGANEGIADVNSRIPHHGHPHNISLPDHGHGFSDPGHSHLIDEYEFGTAGGALSIGHSNQASGALRKQSWIRAQGTGASVGGATSLPAINGQVGPGLSQTQTPPYLVVHYVIRAQ